MNRELHFEIKQGVAYLRLNRPEHGNAINLALANQLLQAAMQCHHDPKIRCVILTGTGRFFCVGGDVADFAQADQNTSILINELASTLHLAMSSLMRMSKPLVVMVNGITAGAGMGLSLIGDLVIVDEKAKFTPAYSAIGLSPDAGLTWQLPKLVGMRKAQEILLLNQTLSASSALQYGLITEVVSFDQLETRVQDLVNQLMPVASVLSTDDHENFIESVGKPALHVQTEIMDENGTILPLGHIGEIVHRSCHLTLGYDQNIEKTNESFSNGWFHSGDLGYFNEHGFLYIVDRIKDMVKTGGENVSTREVEEVIYTLEGIKEVAVIGLPHDHWIEEVVAVIIKHEHAELDENKILQHCRTRLSSYKAPKKVFFRTELPKNASGKILKRELKNYYKNMQNAIA